MERLTNARVTGVCPKWAGTGMPVGRSRRPKRRTAARAMPEPPSVVLVGRRRRRSLQLASVFALRS